MHRQSLHAVLRNIWSILTAGRQAGPEHRTTSIIATASSYRGFQTYLQDWAHSICCGTSQHLAELVEGLQVSLEKKGRVRTLLTGSLSAPQGNSAEDRHPAGMLPETQELPLHMNLDAKPTLGAVLPQDPEM